MSGSELTIRSYPISLKIYHHELVQALRKKNHSLQPKYPLTSAPSSTTALFKARTYPEKYPTLSASFIAWSFGREFSFSTGNPFSVTLDTLSSGKWCGWEVRMVGTSSIIGRIWGLNGWGLTRLVFGRSLIGSQTKWHEVDVLLMFHERD